jgi:hypothetical protein
LIAWGGGKYEYYCTYKIGRGRRSLFSPVRGDTIASLSRQGQILRYEKRWEKFQKKKKKKKNAVEILGRAASLTEDGILVQIEVAFT